MSDLSKHVKSLSEGAAAFKAKHGSVECIVHPDSPIAQHRIERIDGVRIAVDEVRFVNHKTRERTKLAPSEVYFHLDDDPLFGSKSEPDGDFWGDDDD